MHPQQMWKKEEGGGEGCEIETGGLQYLDELAATKPVSKERDQ